MGEATDKPKDKTPPKDVSQEDEEGPDVSGPGAEEGSEEGNDLANPASKEGDDEGMHMPGVLPEQGVVEGEREMSAQERAILKDLEENLPPEAREGPEGTPEPAGTGGQTAVLADANAVAPAATGAAQSTAPASSAQVTAAEAQKPPKKPFLPWWLAVLLYGGIGVWAIYSGINRDTTTVFRVLFIGLGLYMLWGAYESFRDRNKGQQPAEGTATQQSPSQPDQPQPLQPEQPQT